MGERDEIPVSGRVADRAGKRSPGLSIIGAVEECQDRAQFRALL
jgi:hypothetical protein